MNTKEETLKQNGCYNQNYENVVASVFKATPFFDRKDIVQVKYEMIRAATNAEGSITEISDAYGFSRKSYYQISKAFQDGGLYALLPKKTGPKNPHKLNQDAAAFIDSFLAGHADAKAKEVSAALEAEMGIRVHPRTIYRYLKKNG
jgi:transposase